MDLNWEDYRTILHLVRGKSLAAAAKTLGINYTSISRRITRAETALGQDLFERLPSGYVPNDLAREIASAAEQMEAQSDQFLRSVSARENVLSGSLTITTPQLLVPNYIGPVIKLFSAAHPNVCVNVKATNEPLNLNRREADIAIRVSNAPDENLVGVRLTKQRTALYAEDSIVREIEENPDKPFSFIWFQHWDELPEEGLRFRSNTEAKYVFDDMPAALGAALAGLGIIRLPKFLGRATAGLSLISSVEPRPYIDIWALTHADMKDAPKVRAFKDILIPFFKKHQSKFTD